METKKYKIGFILVLAVTVLVFSPSLMNGLVWEDTLNLLENTDWRGLKPGWWFSSFLGGDYKPLVWASYSFDYFFWRTTPAGYHLGNVLLHALNAVLVYLLIIALGRGRVKPWASVLAALFFSLHPLRVESVGWVTERKDVLFAFCYFLAVLAYLRRPKSSSPARWYLLSLAFALLASLAKAMAVSLPAVLLLIDYYPLKRLKDDPKKAILEKVPYLLPALATAAAAIVGQAKYGSIAPLERWNFFERLLLAGRSGIFYLLKTTWPSDLLPIYTFDPRSASFTIIGLVSLAVLAVLTGLVFYLAGKGRKDRAISKELAFSWSWYLLTWLPISGLVPAGLAVIADRFSYIPAVGISFLLAVLISRIKVKRPAYLPAVGFALLAALSWATIRQEAFWKDSVVLWSNFPDYSTAVSHYNLGNALNRIGEEGEAVAHYRRAVEIDPGYGEAFYNMGISLAEAGRFEEAVTCYREALRLKPESAETLNNLANALVELGEIEEAQNCYASALLFSPDLVEAHSNLANTLAAQGKFTEAISYYRKALESDPANSETNYNLAVTLALEGDPAGAEEHYRKTLETSPDHAKTHYNLGLLLIREGKIKEALEHLEAAVWFERGEARFRKALHSLQGRLKEDR